jgi:hypothetical protein
MSRVTPLGALARGLAAGAAGTAAMTAYQLLVAKLQRKSLSTPVPRRWADAPAPAQVGKRFAEGVLGRRVTLEDVPRLTSIVHWATGIAWGGAYGLIEATFEEPSLVAGLGFGTGVWAASYAQLVPLRIYKLPWEYPLPEEVLDLSYHLVYGLGVAAAYAVLDS